MENILQKVYWCQCFEIQKRITEMVRGKAISERDTGKICNKCGYKIFETIVDKKEYADFIFEKYQVLKEMVEPKVQDGNPGEKCTSQYINLEDLKEMEETQKELENFLFYLSEDKLRELLNDNYFTEQIKNIPFNR